MADKGWNNLGSDLNRIIEDAVHMGNFGRLNESINDTIRKAFQTFDGEEFRSGDGWDFNLSKNAPKEDVNKHPSGGSAQAQADAGTRRGKTDAYNGYRYAYKQAPVYDEAKNRLFAGSGKRRGGAIVMLIVGILLTALSVIPLSIFLVGTLMFADKFGIAFSVVFVAVLAAGIVFIVKGGSGLKLAARFDRYMRNLNGEEYGDIKTLATYCHRPEDEVLKDIKKMLSKGWFIEGHLDNSEKCLMVSNKAYEQYLDTLRSARIRAEEQKRKMEEEAKRNGGMTPEVRSIIQKGEEYIDSIRKSNDAIPGEEISEKIYRMELLVRRIFQQTEAHPENAPDLRRLMEYYLPMTVKLLKAYEELDGQPVQGENIVGSKKEIEDTLDTLNVAFEKLLDNLFQDTALDVSSDISVLQTMLAQEGLTEDGLNK